MVIWTLELKEVEKLYDSFKGRLPDLEKELEQLIHTQDANVVMLYSRRCLEVIIADLCERELKRPRKTEPLQGIIEKLHKEEKVPPHIITSMLNLNSLSNYGAHPKEFDTRQVRTALISLETVIAWYLKYSNIEILLKPYEKTAELEEQNKEPDKKARSGKQKLVSGIVILIIIVTIVTIYVYPKLFNRSILGKPEISDKRISVAVMPFQNNTNDSLLDEWQDGIQGILINSLSNSEDLKVQQTTLITSYLKSKGLNSYASITPSVASTISKKLDANFLIFGGIIQEGSILRLNAQLIDSKTEEVIKSFQIDGVSDKIITTTDSLSKMIRNYLIISKLGKGVSPVILSSIPLLTNSPEAYRYYLYGSNAYATGDLVTAKNWFLKSFEIDSTFFMPAYLLSATYMGLRMYDKSKYWCQRLYKKRDQLKDIDQIRINFMYTKCFGTDFEAIKYLTQLTELDKNDVIDLHLLGLNYYFVGQYNKAIPVLERALKIYDEWDSKPYWVVDYTLLGNAYHKTGQYKKEKRLYKKAEQDFPDSPDIILLQAILSLTEGDTNEANQYIEKIRTILKENSASEAAIVHILATIYSEAGIFDKAEEFYRKALLLQAKSPGRMNNLGYFLIDKDRNISEGLELVDRALKLSPENYEFLDTKGWGLYKQGKYVEALEILQKSWDLRMKNAIYRHESYLHLEAAKKAVANQKNY